MQIANTGENGARRRPWEWAWLGAGLAAYAVLAYLNAWLSDDALISLRTADNVLHGYGLRWNTAERVQTFTHPLWLFALTGAHALTGEPFYSSLWLSLLVSVAAVGCMLLTTPGQLADKTVVLCALLFSQAFMDFSSSGLENPLTHLFCAAFVAAEQSQRSPKARALWLSGIAGLATFNRLDTLLLFAPVLLVDAFRMRDVRWHVVGALPVIAWELFSLLYYGFPFPNTAYAKLTQDSTDRFKLLLDGFNYLRSSLESDPLTLSAIAGCLLLVSLPRRRTGGLLVAGALLYIGYVLRIGGDFMSGRFLSAPLFLCLGWLASHAVLRSRQLQMLAALACIALGLLGRWPPPLTGADFKLAPGENEVDRFGIHNERRMFFAINSLRNARRMNPLRVDHPWSSSGFRMRAAAQRDPAARVQVVDAIGHAGYFAGPHVHVVDHWALADALIARLPALFGRYGHYPRVIPEGYIETLRSGREQLRDPDLAAYYHELALVLKGPLWAPERLRAIWHLNTTRATPLDRYAFVRHSPMTIRLRLLNNTAHTSVLSYVWNDFRTTSYVLDTASSRGRSYEVVWQITPQGASISAPPGLVPTAQLDGLRERGFFTISLGFADDPKGPLLDLHELRYTYELVHGELIVQRQPWPVYIQNFPVGPWHDGQMPGVLQVEESH